MTFKQALRILPTCLQSGLDPLGQHQNIGDLRFMAQHELDLHFEGDIKLTPRQMRSIQMFLNRTGDEPHMPRNQYLKSR